MKSDSELFEENLKAFKYTFTRRQGMVEITSAVEVLVLDSKGEQAQYAHTCNELTKRTISELLHKGQKFGAILIKAPEYDYLTCRFVEPLLDYVDIRRMSVPNMFCITLKDAHLITTGESAIIPVLVNLARIQRGETPSIIILARTFLTYSALLKRINDLHNAAHIKESDIDCSINKNFTFIDNQWLLPLS